MCVCVELIFLSLNTSRAIKQNYRHPAGSEQIGMGFSLLDDLRVMRGKTHRVCRVMGNFQFARSYRTHVTARRRTQFTIGVLREIFEYIYCLF